MRVLVFEECVGTDAEWPVMRLGKPLEHLQAALRVTQSAGPTGEQITSIGRQLAYAGYLSYDAVIWVSALHSYS